MSCESTWLDGPALYRWLQGHRLEPMEAQLGYHARAVRHWRDGAKASVQEADVVLIKLDLHLDMLPDECWVPPRPPKPARTSCPNGHEYTGQTSFVNVHGHRTCRVCRRNAERRKQARKLVAA